MRRMFMTAAGIVSLACVATWSVADAASSLGSTGTSVQTGRQQTATSRSKTKRSKIERPHTNWLNPQPEPPLPASKTPIQRGNWLNPQPEPPRPDTKKKVH